MGCVTEYRIMGAREEYLKVTKETDGGYSVLITRTEAGYKEEQSEFLPRALFETCLRTRYLVPSGDRVTA